MSGPAAPRGGFVRRADRELISVAGRDRTRFLNGYVTVDLATAGEGAVRSGFLTSREGRVLADLDVAVSGERLLVSLPAGRTAPVLEHLGKYVLAADVAWTPLAGHAVLGLYGSVAEGPASAALRASDGVVVDRPLGTLPGLELWGERGALEAAVARLAAAGVAEAAGGAFDALRVAALFGLWGVDFDEAHFPQETGRGAAAISTTKGCYLGQEVVARIHYRGGVQRALRGLRLERLAPRGAVVLAEGREAGALGTVVPTETGALALAVLHRRAGAAGARVAIAAAGEATLFDPPFAAP